MKSRKEKAKASGIRRKVAVVIVSLTVAVAATTGMAYADADIAGTLSSWFGKKTDIAMQSLAQSVSSETDKQKARLKEELKLRLEASSQELDAYTDEQKKLYAQAIEQYADALIAGMSIDNTQDREQIRRKLLTIADSAKAAMSALAESYAPPAESYVPPADRPAGEAPAEARDGPGAPQTPQTQGSPSVADAVYDS
ncbi:hypothetical protein [Cohnella hashimotonis]|uniref:Molecular chaperone Skp n=1 Tax=Cohnella hashimotonis TaxID=2826895 RepID=A0ABT6TSM6_9BACL|nr:hypothetical protein [Cohnella hashimotonis]MDI4649852.1 hypothetical protein [Cohnella hashimotonis]